MYMCNLFYLVDKQTGLKFQANKRTLFLNGTTLYAPNNNQFVRLSILDLLSEANRLSRFPLYYKVTRYLRQCFKVECEGNS